jgi:hypothetical protein
MATQNNNIDNLSDVRPDTGINGNVSPQQLPIRGEKRIINAPTSPTTVTNEFNGVLGQNAPSVFSDTGRTQLVDQTDFNATAALAPYTDYLLIRLYNRGLQGNGQPSGMPAVYRFLINPSQVVVNRTQLDAQALARSGWQVGVWGEDSLNISLTGKTAGQYFAFGTTDRYQPFTESYRNLEQLQVVFENNGYWFEGEQAAEGPLGGGPDFARRIIKMHSDVELVVGNFIWYGMFESLTVSQDASTPFLMNFQISFIAWKERFRKQSPYKDTIHNDIKRGHDYGTWQPAAIAFQQNTSIPGVSTAVAIAPDVAFPVLPPPSLLIPPAQPAPPAPATLAAAASNTYAQVDPTANDTTFTTPVLNYSTPLEQGFWKGILSPLTIGNGGKNT